VSEDASGSKGHESKINMEMTIQNKRFTGILIAIPVLLLIPLVAMRFTDEVKWTASDFVVMGGLLLLTGTTIELALRVVRTTFARLAVCGMILFLFVMIWGELATGFFRRMIAGS